MIPFPTMITFMLSTLPLKKLLLWSVTGKYKITLKYEKRLTLALKKNNNGWHIIKTT